MSAGSPMQEAHLLLQLGGHPHLQDLPLLRVLPHPLVCPHQGPQLWGKEQGEALPLRPLSLQQDPVVEGPGPLAWPQLLPEPNSGKSASRRRPQGDPQPPKLRALEAQVEGSWKR